MQAQLRYDLRRPQIEAQGDILVRLGEDYRKAVVFFGVGSQSSTQYGGTGFLLSYEDHTYLVTAAHVAQQLGDTGFAIRFNTRDGGARELWPERVEWQAHPDSSVDVAVAEWLPPREAELVAIRGNDLATSEKRETKNIGPGSLAHIVGLFRLHYGKQRNLPVVHTGHIALNPEDERIPVRDRVTGQRIETEGYLVEAQTLDGLSGSPVFVRRSLEATHKKMARPPVRTWVYGAVFLLGIYISSWDGEPGALLAEDRNLDRSKVRVPVGMGVVAPAEKIREILDMPRFKDRREAAKEREVSERESSTDSALPAKAENPRHKEDFNSLLNAAVRKPRRDDQT